MECNKDEAAKAKEIAGKKLMEKDIEGAKKFALKAQSLFPALEGLSHFMATLDVHISAEKRINGEVDWYGVFGVDSRADEETLRKRYRKLALTLHPDKNKSVGSEGAFRILSEAWSLLSDKAKRTAYDQKRELRTIYQKVMTGNPSMSSGMNGSCSFSKRSNSSTMNQNTFTNRQPTPGAPRPSNPSTFWTICNSCQVQYEYLRKYLNRQLSCPNCRVPFLAIEIHNIPPINGQKSSTSWSSYHQQQNVKPASAPTMGTPEFAGVNSTIGANIQQGPFSKLGGMSSFSAQAAQVVQSATANLKRAYEGAQTASSSDVYTKCGIGLASNAGSTSGKVGRPKKKRRVDDVKSNSNGKETGGRRGGVTVNRTVTAGLERVTFSERSKPNSTRDLSQPELRSMLTEKAKIEIRKKLNEWSVTATSKALSEEGKNIKNEMPKAAINDVKRSTGKVLLKDVNMKVANADNKNSVQLNSSSSATDNVDSVEEAAESMLMNVPDPDFHDFDKDRTENSFSENQVWAAYDDDDGMPRYYALIHNVISKRPFKMRISWLNSKSNAELGPINWVGLGFPKTSGIFWVGNHIVYTTLNSFSHKVNWTKGTRGVIQIFPRKGDVWALYRNWSPDWHELTPDEVIHKYDVVEILEDYNEEQGVTIAPLVKVAGFKSVFHKHLDAAEVRKIPREEIFRFSHQVPSYLLTGEEAQNAPNGFWELDPAAMPLELLQVITETKELSRVANTEHTMNQDQLEIVQKVKEELCVANDAQITDKGRTGCARNSDTKSSRGELKTYQRKRVGGKGTKVVGGHQS